VTSGSGNTKNVNGIQMYGGIHNDHPPPHSDLRDMQMIEKQVEKLEKM